MEILYKKFPGLVIHRSSTCSTNFKRKVWAASQRAKFHDSVDLRWLRAKYRLQIRERASELNHSFVGLAICLYDFRASIG
ncbi:hypothetical protein jhhlp_005017 [Lomentospora prolificans]|uniref:Uncharacterized protein n=1 Tax=Lomentospora prolificans TaxID=41688 RepID=A0A2N3N848_9PEZI|nr:hypothetical protein jhhlp_005017 [Lomentospora prolificans]